MGKQIALLLFLALLTPLPQGFCAPAKMNLDFTLAAPKDAVHQGYLGLETMEPFVLNQIKAKILVIEIFSMYCPICQREAADVNKVFELIQADANLKNQVRLIGIGAGNSAFEVDFFRENYQIQFPLFSDEKFLIHKKIGEVGTPYFIGLKQNEKNQFEIFYSQSGEITDPEEFLQQLIKGSGLKP